MAPFLLGGQAFSRVVVLVVNCQLTSPAPQPRGKTVTSVTLKQDALQ